MADLANINNLTSNELAGMLRDLQHQGRVIGDAMKSRTPTQADVEELSHITDQIEVVDSAYKERAYRKSLEPAPHVPFPSGGSTPSQTWSGNFNNDHSTKSFGEIFTSSAGYRTQVGHTNRPQFDIDFGVGSVERALGAVKATMTVGTAANPNRLAVTPLIGVQPPNLLDFIGVEAIGGGAHSYLQEGTFSDNALTVDEGTAKPEATLALAPVNVVFRTVAVHLPVTKQTLEDVQDAASYVESRLSMMVKRKTEQQVIAGTGAAGPPSQIRGYLNVVGIQTQARGTDTNLDAVFKAMQKIRSLGFAEPDAIVMHPDNFTPIQLYKSTDGNYSFDVTNEGVLRLFGKPLVLSTTITANTALVGNFNTHSKIYVNGTLRSTSAFINDDFTRNILRFLVEWRADLAVFRPTAFCSVTGLN